MKRIRNFLKEHQWLIRIVLYLIITVLCSVYIILNWCDALAFTFFDDFDGLNLLFIVWIVLLLLPIIGSLKIFGLEFNFWEQQKKEKVDEYQAMLDEKMNKIDEIIQQSKNNDIDGGTF